MRSVWIRGISLAGIREVAEHGGKEPVVSRAGVPVRPKARSCAAVEYSRSPDVYSRITEVERMKRIALALVSSLALTGSAFAAGTGSSATKAPTQTHHCVAKDGTAQPTLTHKECTKAGGTWKKDATPATATPESKPAQTAPAPKAEPAPAPKATEPAPAPKTAEPSKTAPAAPPAK